MLPEGFIKQMRMLLGKESDRFFKAMEEPPVTSVRLNRRKPGAYFPDATPVSWCRCGFYLKERPLFTLDPLLHAGAYYVQDASSMIIHEVVSRISERISVESGMESPLPLTLLDLCAAPGGKTTAMIDALPDGSEIVANEYVTKRASILRENLAKWGYPGVTVTNYDSSRFALNSDRFDIVAVDAPCSGEGMMRKEKSAVEQWSIRLIEDCSKLQREILANAVNVLKPGGFLIYSTCTFNRKENEENAEFIVREFGLQPVDMDFPEEWGIPRGIGTTLPVYRFMPHRTSGEGLFLSVFRNPGDLEPSRITEKPATRKRLPAIPVVNKKTAGKSYGNNEIGNIPEIEKILSVDFDRSRYPEAEVTREQAISYLRRESIILPPDIPKGHVVITYNRLPLGMAKNIGTRANNLYPKNWRILMQLSS